MCAAQGKLPNQRGHELHFATPPKALDLAWYRDPTLTGEWWGMDHKSTFAVSDVFFAEVAILTHVCANAGEALFAIERGETFVCDLDMRSYWELASALEGGHALPPGHAVER